MIVVTIIGILVAFILRASMGGIRQAEQKATISLIAKLEAGMTDRVDALASQHPEPTAAHYVLAQTYNSMFSMGPPINHPWPNPSRPAAQRAQVIAQYDMLRAELPDAFLIQRAAGGSGDGVYPLNFGGASHGDSGDWRDYLLPLGSHIPQLPLNSAYNYATYLLNQPIQANEIGITPQNTGMMIDPTNPARNTLVPIPSGGVRPTGIYGASFAAAAAIYRQLGYGPAGTNGADDDGDGDIDDLQEGLRGQPAGTVTEIATKLANHKHETCRAEMLYAILIEGTGPWAASSRRTTSTAAR